MDSTSPAGRVDDAIVKGEAVLASRQWADGSWHGDDAGPDFLLALAAIFYHVTGHELPPVKREAVVSRLRSTLAEDGSVGLHVENSGCMFTSALTYVALRVMGVSAEDPDAVRLRTWIRANGTPLFAAPWGKFMLAVMNLYPYDQILPVLPEVWLLPRSLPFHPGRFWCWTRQVYLPMAALYGARARVEETPLTHALRRELYGEPYDAVPFARHRLAAGPEDDLIPGSRLLAWGIDRCLALYERHRPARLRARALDEVMRHIDYEEDATDGICIGLTNRILNGLVYYFRSPRDSRLPRAMEALDEYLFRGDRVILNGYDSGLWDTTFAVQAVLAMPHAAEHADLLQRAGDYIRHAQLLADPPRRRRFYRSPTKGAWTLSDGRHGWAVIDCTGEGLKSALLLGGTFADPLPPERLRAAVDLLLRWQNPSGGWGTYERRRGPAWLERLNPMFVFDKVMADHPCTECTSSCVQGLAAAQRHLPEYRAKEVARAVARGARFIRREQRADGGWEGSWGVCFTYGTWFGVEGLLAAGERPDSTPIQNACAFLLAHQNPDGGWGESWRNCLAQAYLPDCPSSCENTSWALMTLVLGGKAGSVAAERAAEFLVGRQGADGEWPREQITGLFSRTGLIRFDSYRRIFPLRALAMWREATTR